jgi:hypothetical protein
MKKVRNVEGALADFSRRAYFVLARSWGQYFGSFCPGLLLIQQNWKASSNCCRGRCRKRLVSLAHIIFVYCRPHGAEQLYASRYSDDALDLWADRPNGRFVYEEKYKKIAARDVYVYFDNDMKVRAPLYAKNPRDHLERRLATNRTGRLSLEDR